MVFRLISSSKWMLVLLVALVVAGCGTPTPEPTPTITATSPPPTSTLTPSPSPTLEVLVFAVPPEWQSQAAEAVASLDAPQLIFNTVANEDPATALASGQAQIALVPGADGTVVSQFPIVIGVPFLSETYNITPFEAEYLVREGSPFVTVLPWNQMTPDLKPLLVNGFFPTDPGYPILGSWSLQAAPGYEEWPERIAESLGPLMDFDPGAHVLAVGDINLARAMEPAYEGNPDYPFVDVSEYLQSADFALGNFESAIGTIGTPAEGKVFTFQAPPDAAAILARVGFDLMSLANNHAMDFGGESLLEGIQLLEAEGIVALGAGANREAAHEPYLIEIDGVRLAFLAYVDVPAEYVGYDIRIWEAGTVLPGVAWADPRRMAEDVAAIAGEVDHVIVVLHSGFELVQSPSSIQRQASRAAIDAGASVVMGHHTHVLQGVEYYNDGVIFYGLGNFLFQDAGPPESAMLNLWFSRDRLLSFWFQPVLIGEDGRPRIPAFEDASAIQEEIRSLSVGLSQ
jgi:poly-gamma-glutamate synthesis protein (capsule biosynthesis protein)